MKLRCYSLKPNAPEDKRELRAGKGRPDSPG
jgi:hypothetical protein